MRRLSFGVFLIALSTLVLELMLTRIIDVTLTPNMAYFVISVAIFGFGLAGIYVALRPIRKNQDIRPLLVRLGIGFGAVVALLVPIMNFLPTDPYRILAAPIVTGVSFILLFLALVTPFFLSGYFLIAVFSTYAAQIQRLYFWDLVGAGLGGIAVIPLIPLIGPTGMILWVAAVGLLVAVMFARAKAIIGVASIVAISLVLLPLLKLPNYIEVRHHQDKRGVKTAIEEGRREAIRWDPISLIYVIDLPGAKQDPDESHFRGDTKLLQYDGGNQTSHLFHFDGDLQKLRNQFDTDKSAIYRHFWQLGVLASHYLKRDTDQRVMIIGSAGGQETKAALMYGAKEVHAYELVSAVVDLVTGDYADYIGNIFSHPAVTVRAAEGRSALRASQATFDIIQIFSNHTSSSIAQGTGALSPTYLQTAEAYEEYFSHLAPEGILHINHHLYPRMITTAALAWANMGRSDFSRHVVVFVSQGDLSLPTLLIKMTPWTAEEIQSLAAFIAPDELLENPLDRGNSFLSADFYSGQLPAALEERIPMRVTARTDDTPYFNFVRKDFETQRFADQNVFVDAGMVYLSNKQMYRGIPMDIIHLILVGIGSIIFIVGFVIVPLRYSKVARDVGKSVSPMLVYFSCLGAGFIIVELVLIQKFMHLVGSPLYTYSTVICAMLIGAGLGSGASEVLGIRCDDKWAFPFIAIIVYGLALIFSMPYLFNYAIGLNTLFRVLFSIGIILPLGFFMGMPFPLGILAIKDRPSGAVAWAWGMNGVFTITGGLASVLLSLMLGFNLTLVIAMGIYGLAFATFPLMRDSNLETHEGAV